MIELPFPPSSLSGHNKGHWRAKSAIVAKHREWARLATLEVLPPCFRALERGDIRLVITFYPPDRRGDRINFPNRMKPYFDGIADALKVNDSRFVPVYYFAEPVKNGKVVVIIEPARIPAIHTDLAIEGRSTDLSTVLAHRVPRLSAI